MAKLLLSGAGAAGAVGLVIFGFLIYPVFGLVWLATITILAILFSVIELRNRHIKGTVELIQASKIHADNSTLLYKGQIVQLQPGQLGYGTVSNLHTYSPRQELVAPLVAPATTPAALVLPGPEPTIYKPLTLAETLASLPRNELAVCFGIDPATGREETSTLYGTMHTMIGASTGMGKSSLLAGLLAQLVTANRPSLFGLYICDAKRTTGRWFEGHAQRVAYSLNDILQTVGAVQTELKRRMVGMLLDEQPVILVVEEALATRKMFSRLEDRKAALNQFTGCLDDIALLGREFGIFLYWCSQVDYASQELQDVRGQFAARLAGSLMPTAAQSMGFQSKELVKQLWEQRQPGQFLIESPAGSRLILAPRLNLRSGELASYLQGGATVTPRTQPEPSDYRSTPAPQPGREPSRPVTAQFREISTSAPSYYDSLPGPSLKSRALAAFRNGANSQARLALALGINENEARRLLIQLRDEGLIEWGKKAG